MLQKRASDLQPFLDKLLRRSVLSEAEQQAILGLPTHAIQAERNQDVVRIGALVDHACFIVDGLLARFDQNSKGARQITALHLKGDMPDLLSVVQPTATSALQALSATTLLLVPHQALRDVAARHPAVAEAFWRDCTVDAMVMAQWLVNLGRRDAKARIAHLLCEICTRLGVRTGNGASVKFRLNMTQEHLADATGLTPVHVNRSLMALREIGAHWRRGVVYIEDWRRLAIAGDFDPAYLQMDIAHDQRLRIALPWS